MAERRLFLDDLPAEFAAEAIAETVERATKAESGGPPNLRHFGEHLVALGKEDLPGETSQLVTVDGLICQLMIANDDQATTCAELPGLATPLP